MRRVILYLLARVLGKERVSRRSRVHVYYIKKPKPLASIVPSQKHTQKHSKNTIVKTFKI